MTNNILFIKNLSIWIFIIPIISINACLIIVTTFPDAILGTQGAAIGFTIPYIDGGTSISRTARVFPSYFIFKPAMIITAILLIIYWKKNSDLMTEIDNNMNYNKYFKFFGIASAIFLILHSIFLGIKFDNDIYKFFRRFIILSFIIFELCAQAFLVTNLQKIKIKISERISTKVLTIKTCLIIVLIVVAILSVPIIISSGHTHFKHALEWNYFFAVVCFYLLTYFFWRKTPVHTP